MYSPSLLRIKTPSQLAISDVGRRARTPPRSCLKKSVDSSLDFIPSFHLTPGQINNSLSSVWMSSQSSLDSSFETESPRRRKEVSFSDLRPRTESTQRCSTPINPTMTRRTKSVTNLASKWSTQPNLPNETPVYTNARSKSVHDKGMDEEVKTRHSRSVNLKLPSASHKKLNQRKMLLKGMSSFIRCVVGDNKDRLENSFEEFIRDRANKRLNKTDTETGGGYLSTRHVSNDIGVTNSQHSKACPDNLLSNTKSRRVTSQHSLASSVQEHNTSDECLLQQCRCHVLRLSFDGPDSDDVYYKDSKENRPLDQSMNEFMKSADLENLASIMAFYDKVVNNSQTLITAV